MDFDPDEIVTLSGAEMTARTAIRRLIANPPRQPSDFTIVRDGKQSILKGTDIERLARSWGLAF
jgi:hypothetical protein